MTHFPALTKAAAMMARSNGGINRYRGEKEFLNDLEAVLMHAPQDIAAIDVWLAKKSDDEILNIVDGEEAKRQAALNGAPDGTDMLLNDIFENAV